MVMPSYLRTESPPKGLGLGIIVTLLTLCDLARGDAPQTKLPQTLIAEANDMQNKAEDRRCSNQCIELYQAALAHLSRASIGARQRQGQQARLNALLGLGKAHCDQGEDSKARQRLEEFLLEGKRLSPKALRRRVGQMGQMVMVQKLLTQTDTQGCARSYAAYKLNLPKSMVEEYELTREATLALKLARHYARIPQCGAALDWLARYKSGQGQEAAIGADDDGLRACQLTESEGAGTIAAVENAPQPSNPVDVVSKARIPLEHIGPALGQSTTIIVTAPTLPVRPRITRGQALRIGGIMSLSLGGASAITSATLGALAQREARALEYDVARTGGWTGGFDQRVSMGQTLQSSAYALGGCAVAFAALGSVLTVLGTRQPDGLALGVGPAPLGLTLRGVLAP